MVDNRIFEKYSRVSQLILSALPKKLQPVALTLHHIGEYDFGWFSEFIDLLQKNYEFIDPHNLDGISNQAPRSILLTFDDGFRSNKKLAEKILEPRGIKALFFVTGKFIGLSKDTAENFVNSNFFRGRKVLRKYNGEFDAMNFSDLNWLIERGHKIGFHTDNHKMLSDLMFEDQINEVVTSSERLEQKLGIKIDTFAYPFGRLSSLDKNSIELVKNRYRFGFSNIRGSLIESPSNKFFFRQNITPNLPLWLANSMVQGKLDLVHQKQRSLAHKTFKLFI